MPVSPDDPWIPDLERHSGPIYLRIVEALAEARATGTLRPGDRLPPQRELARRLAVDLTTVSRAFGEARHRNLIDAAVGRGTFVTARGEEAPILDLGMNIPPAPAGLGLPGLIRGGIDAILRRSSAEALLSYQSGPGSPAERGAAALWLEPAAAGRLPLERVGVGAGAQALLAAVLLALARPGDTVLTDTLTYPGVIEIARTLGLRLAGVDADADGMRPDRLEALARAYGARVVYLNPTLHNPTTLVMGEARRREIAARARTMGLLIIEDDPYSPLLEAAAPPAFLALAPDLTYHVATLAKALSPFLRTAFVAAPSAGALAGVAAALRGVTLMAAPLMTNLAAEWVRSGVAAQVVAAVRAEVSARQALAARILPGRLRTHPHALHAWLELRDDAAAARIADTARARGLAVRPAIDFAVGPSPAGAVRISLGAVESRDRLAEALGKLAAMVDDAAPRPAIPV